MTGQVLVALLLVGLGLGTFGTEATTLVALAYAVVRGDRSALAGLGGPLLALAAAFLLAAPLGGPGAWREVVGRVWPLAPLLAVPALVRARDARIELLGLLAACLPAAWGIGQRLLGEAGTGPFSHHLTLGYALCAPLAVAASRGRWPVVVVLLAGIASTGGSGPLLSAVVVLAGARLVAPAGALAGGLAVVLALLSVGARLGRPDVLERAVLWTGGAWLALDRPVGTGTGHYRDAASVVQDLVQPGFHFPLHAHDSALQLAGLAGLGAWIALAWLVVELWRRVDRGGRALLAALCVGSLTQDLLGDLEAARAAAAWLAWAALPTSPGEPAHDEAVP